MTVLVLSTTVGLPTERGMSPVILSAGTIQRRLTALGLVDATTAVLIHGPLLGTSVKNVLSSAHR